MIPSMRRWLTIDKLLSGSLNLFCVANLYRKTFFYCEIYTAKVKVNAVFE
uniref:Uncharacterized protein n=1 Tax=Arundo donax TaxID=35708 RepID=A0A0A9CTI4_ARUDO